MKEIKQNRQVVKALNTIKDYCHDHPDCYNCILKEGCRELPEFKPMDIKIPSLAPEISTLEEECLKYYLDKGFKWITREYGDVFCWTEKPHREKQIHDMWVAPRTADVETNDMFNDLFTFVKEDDTEPWKIEYILGLSEDIE